MDFFVEFDRAFRSSGRVQGYTHDFYKYPARFSPNFAQYVLKSLTEPGDYVLDPFMGGGTTIVEATASGRRAVGSDLNELARFVARVKTTPLSERDIAEIRIWVREVREAVAKIDSNSQPIEVAVRNMPVETQTFFVAATRLVDRLQFPRRRRFAKCALVRVGQWALDATLSIPSAEELSDELETRVEKMVHGLSEFASAAMVGGIHKNKITAVRKLMGLPAADPNLTKILRRQNIQPKLILTSPPYPGVHVLYHRWQVLGRRETPAPYWIAGIQDGHYASYYTLGSRTELGLRNYFAGIVAAFGNLRQIAVPETIVVQLMSFSDKVAQLPMYLDAMNKAGFEETSIRGIDSQQIRQVPNRKWYTQRRARNDASREVLLVHRPAG